MEHIGFHLEKHFPEKGSHAPPLVRLPEGDGQDYTVNAFHGNKARSHTTDPAGRSYMSPRRGLGS